MRVSAVLRRFRIRRRDCIMWVFVWALSVLCVINTGLVLFAVFVRCRGLETQYLEGASVVTNYLASAQSAINAYASALDDVRYHFLSGAMLDTSKFGATNDAPAEIVLGTGRVRTSTGRIITYVDVRLSDGQVERRYRR